jgi:hypothetical protein
MVAHNVVGTLPFVQSTPIAHPRSAARHRDNVAVRGYAVARGA